MQLKSAYGLPSRKRYPINGPRSHGACASCKRSHVKCDEKKPTCSRCARMTMSCAYEHFLRKSERPSEKHLQPRMILPLNKNADLERLSNITLPATAPIFQLGDFRNCFVVQMPYKSDELFDYFYVLRDSTDATTRERRKDRLVSIMQTGDAFRNTMMIAGIHYTWRTGLTKFIPALLFHKIEAMRLLNGFLGQSTPRYGACVRQIATLCLIECALGNIKTSETHLNGLVRFMDAFKLSHLSEEFMLDKEVSNRYVTLIYGLTLGFKNHGQDISDTYHYPGSDERLSPAVFEDMIHGSRQGDCPCLESRLKALELLPFFFGELPSMTRFHDIDSTPILNCLVALTEPRHAGLRQGKRSKRAGADFLFHFALSHIDSISKDHDALPIKKTQPGFYSSWSGLCSASTIYLHVILELGMQGGPMEPSLHSRILSILEEDLKNDQGKFDKSSRSSSDLWFWKAFVGALSIEMRSNSEAMEYLRASQKSFYKFINDWSVTSGVTLWGRAKASLENIVWPVGGRAQDLAESLWYNRTI